MPTKTLSAEPRNLAVAKKDPKRADDRQITFRLNHALHDRLQATAAGLGVDLSSLLRLMIKKHLPAYEEEAEEIRRRETREEPE